MSNSKKRGLNFGLTSGIITTLGLMIGLNSAVSSKLAVIGGILTIAIADAFSDSLGMHISEESTGAKPANVLNATKYTFLSKFLVPLTFLIPVLLFSLNTAIIVSIVWAFLFLFYTNYIMAKKIGKNPYPIILEHLTLMFVVILLTHLTGKAINFFFG